MADITIQEAGHILMERLNKEFENNIAEAIKSGALPEDANSMSVAMAIFKITTEKMRLWGIEKELVSNLRWFI